MQAPFTMRIDDPQRLAKGCMRDPFLQEVQSKLSQERCEHLEVAMQKAFEDSTLEDGSCGAQMSALVAIAYKPS